MSDALEKLRAIANAKKNGKTLPPAEKKDSPVQAPEVPAAVPQDGQAEQAGPAEVATSGTPAVLDREEAAPVSEVALTSGSPLEMELAQLQADLLAKVPSFRTVLQDIHRKLKADPAVVTILTDDEIGLIISGLKTHAQVDVIAPQKKKAVKKATAAAKKKVITAGDL